MTARAAARGDLGAIARIYNEDIEGHVTFETEPRSAADVAPWLERPLVVVDDGGEVVAWARASAYRAERPAYDGVGEVGVYRRHARLHGERDCVMVEKLIGEAAA